MIQSPVLSPIPVLPAAGDLPRPNPGEGAELADFGALLALTTSLCTTETMPGEPAETSLPALAPADGTTATGGKSLPVGLPLAVPASEDQKLAAAPAIPAQPGQPAQPEVPVARALGKRQAKPEIGEPSEAAVSAPDVPEAFAAAVSAVTEVIAPVLAPVQPYPALPIASPPPASQQVSGSAAAPEDTSPVPGASQPAAAALAHAAPQAAFLRSVLPGRRAAQPPAGDAAPPEQSPNQAQPAAIAPAPIGQVRIELAPSAPMLRAVPKEELHPATVVPEIDLVSEPMTGAANPAPATNPALAPALAQPITQPSRPHDFSALIDRLVAARDAVQPQAIAVSIPHAEFGQVHLRFRQDEAGLAVAMTSADPGFARAASAMPPVLPVSDPQAAQNQPGQSSARHESAASTGQSGSGQQRGAASERRHDQPHSNHAPAGARQGQGQRRPGIFA